LCGGGSQYSYLKDIADHGHISMNGYWYWVLLKSECGAQRNLGGKMAETIVINEDRCWKCGLPFKNTKELRKTTHHALPKHLNPAKNILLPLHEKCHTEVTMDDTGTLVAFGYNIGRHVKMLVDKIESLQSLLKKRYEKEKY